MAEDAYSGHRDFPTTHWSLIERVRRKGAVADRPALEELLRRYLPALRAHLLNTHRVDGQEIDDLVQGFVCSRVLEHDLVGAADRAMGKFRTFLLTSLDRYVISQRRLRNAEKRGGGQTVSLEQAGIEPAAASAPVPTGAFDLVWVRQLLKQVLEQMEQECLAQGRGIIWEAFQRRLLKPALEDAPRVAYGQLVSDLGFESVMQARNAIIGARRMFVRILRELVGQYAADETEIDAELADLRRVLMECGASSTERSRI